MPRKMTPVMSKYRAVVAHMVNNYYDVNFQCTFYATTLSHG